MPKVKDNCAVLKNGKQMPMLGLGCWQSKKGEVEKAVETALESGYRHIDTAYNYLNEEEVGIGIKNWLKKSRNNQREDLFIVTKLPGIGMSPEGVRKFLDKSLSDLDLKYIDLYLIHSPIGFKGKHDKDVFPMNEEGKFVPDHSTDLIAIWKEMEKCVDEGLIKSLGVSNFSVQQMRKIDAISRIPCVVNQVELHVQFQQKVLVQYCKENNIVVTAYAPLGSPGRASSVLVQHTQAPTLLNNPVVALVAQRHRVTNAQVLLRFLKQEGYVAIPKSVTPSRIKLNADIYGFCLDKTEIAALRLLDQGEAGRTFNFNTFPGLDSHPEFVGYS